MNYNKLTEQLKVYEEKRADLINQFKELVYEIEGLIFDKYKLRPNPEKFADWFINTHTEVFNKKRQLPFRLNRDYIIQFCSEYKTEFDLDALDTSQITLNYDNIYTEKIEYTFSKYLKHMKHKVSNESLLLELINEASEILENGEINFKIRKVERNEFDITLGNLKYLYYCIYNLNPSKNKIRSILIDYVLVKFELFEAQDKDTFYTKFSDKSNDIKKAEKQGLL